MSTAKPTTARQKKTIKEAEAATAPSIAPAAPIAASTKAPADTAAKKAPKTATAAASKPETTSEPAVPHEERVRLAAYRLFLQRGGTHGDHVVDWLAAEAEVAREDADALLPKKAPRRKT